MTLVYWFCYDVGLQAFPQRRAGSHLNNIDAVEMERQASPYCQDKESSLSIHYRWSCFELTGIMEESHEIRLDGTLTGSVIGIII